MNSKVDSNLYSPESERAVLSILLNNPDKIYEVDSLRPEMFSANYFRVIYTTIKKLSMEGNFIQPLLVEEYLRTNGQLEEAGGKETLNYIVSAEISKNNYPIFEKNVIDSYMARTLTQISARIPSMIESASNVEGVMNQLRTSLDDILQASGGAETEILEKLLPEAWESLMSRVKNPGLKGYTTGFTDIDTMTGGITPGELWILASRPSHGKTSWICNSLLRATTGQGLTPLIFSKEMDAQSLIERLVAIDSGINLHGIRTGLIDDSEVELMATSFKKLEKFPIYIDSKFSAGLDYILSTIRKYNRIHKTNLIYIDYVQLVAERTQNAVHELGQISRSLKLLANELGIGVYLLSQLNRSCELRDDKRPMLADLRQSGNLEEDADVVAMLYRDEMYYKDSKYKGLTEFLIRKQRNGPIGSLMLSFDPNTTKMGDK